MTDWIGRTLGRVYIESRLARGGMAEVYLGTHTTLQRKVAVKILRNYDTEELRPQERFELEARAVAQLRHPNIVQVFDFDTIDDQPYLVMEYIAGPSLAKYLSVLHARGDRLGLPLISRLLTRIASALQYAHEKGVIHRDVKPGNILLTSRSIQIVPGETLPLDLEPVLTDFGLVRFLNSSRQTASGLITGTPAYMSPEQAMGQAADGRTDIYSLGIVLYELLSGKVPFDGESTISILLKHVNETPTPIPGLSPALQRVLDRALAKNPHDRFQEPDEFAAAFTTVLETTAQASTLVTIPEVFEAAKANKMGPSRKRANWIPAILAGVLISLIGASFLFNGMIANAKLGTPTTSPPDVSDTPDLRIPVTFGPTGYLQFQDGKAILDQVILVAQAMPAPPVDSQYKVWLVNEHEQLPLGILYLDATNKGELRFDDPQQRNLLAHYHQVQITIEPNAGSDLNGSPDIAYAYTLPEGGIAYLRALMVSFSRTPEQIGLIQGLTRHAKLIDEAGREMLRNYEDGNEAGSREKAESIMNLLVGDQSLDHKDWNGDGQITDPGDGYGFLLNSNNLGYIQAVYSYADYAVNSPGASQNMIINGQKLKVCTENLARWAPVLRHHVSTVLTGPASAEVAQGIQRSAQLSNQMLEGTDINENGEIEAISNECGALVAHEAAYHMADMPLLPVNPEGTPIAISETVTTPQTATPSSLIITTPTKRQQQNQGPATLTSTGQPPANVEPPIVEPPVDEPPPPVEDNPRPTREPRPTKEPKPTQDANPPGNPDPPGNPNPPGNPDRPGNPNQP